MELKMINEVRAVVFCFLFQQASISWISLGAVFSWQRKHSLLVCMKKKNPKQLHMYYLFLSLCSRNHETVFLCVAHICWCLVLLCALVLLLLSTFAHLQNEVVIFKIHIVKIGTCPASHQGVPGPGQYDIRRQPEPHGSRCSFLSQAEVCKCTAHSFSHLQPTSSANLGWYDCIFPLVCVWKYYIQCLSKICSLAESCSTDADRIISRHMTS